MTDDMNVASTDEKNYAYYQLRRFCDSVKGVDGPYYDFIVTANQYSNKFAVVVINLSKLTQPVDTIIREYAKVFNGSSIATQLFVPIVFMYVDLASGIAKFQIVVEWNYGVPKVTSSNARQTWNEHNYSILCNYLDQTVRALPLSMWRVVKKIHFSDPTAISADIMYCRTFRDCYRMAEHPKLNSLEMFYRNLRGIPETDYPSDNLDDMILAVIKDRYPNAEKSSSLMVVNTELREYQRYGENGIAQGEILLMPDCSPFEFLNAYPDGIIPRINLSIFNVLTRDGHSSINSPFVYHADSIQAINDLNHLKQATYQPLTQFLVK